jgi:purine nucleosidase
MPVLRAVSRTISRTAAMITLALSAATALADDAADKRLVILDDDGFGIAEWMVVQAPGVEVLGVTQVTGNEWVKVGVANALRALERAGRTDIPVIPGATYPLMNTEKRTALWEQLYGRLTWKGAWHQEWVEDTEQSLPEYLGPDEMPETLPWGWPTTEAADEIAANFLIRKVREHPGEVTIIAMGPLTNLALAQRLDPSVRRTRAGAGLHGRQPQSAAIAEQRLSGAVCPRIRPFAAP